MEPYPHRSASGVRAFEIQRDGILVQFQSGETYLYTKKSAGAENIRIMHTLARAGRGLSTFISRNVHARYAERSHPRKNADQRSR